MKQYSKFIQYCIVAIVIVFTLIAFFNYKIDSLGLYGPSKYLSEAAKAITDGKMIAGLTNYNDRVFQELVIKQLKVKNDVIAIGSSKMLHLRKRHFLNDDINYFNHSVGGASLEDFIAIVGIYEKIQGYIPKQIILGVDPWVFNKNSGEMRWTSIRSYYDYEIAKIYKKDQLRSKGADFSRWKQLINYDYTIANLKLYFSIFEKGGRIYYVTDTLEVDDTIKETDGSFHYAYSIRNPDYKQVGRAAIRSAKGNVYSLTNFNGLANTEQFEYFIEYLQDKKIDITFYLHPYHPSAYDLIVKNKKYKFLEKTEEYLKKFAMDKKIKIKGSYNPKLNNITSNDFHDDMHGNDNVVKKIFK